MKEKIIREVFAWWLFSFFTTSEAKIGFLLIEVFERQFNSHDYGHLVMGMAFFICHHS
ncbi:MAG: hypothetical protein IMF03_01470 [Proteobacteria bacterium]|nr:hypothetical protein [Pseudomonadota bacterium]